MSVRCPEGHLSEATDYCDVCGTPIVASGGGGMPSAPLPGGSGLDLGPVLPGAGPSAGAPAAPPAPATVTCPHCGAVNVEEALFCEACGYDFTTGTPPMGGAPGGGGVAGAEETSDGDEARGGDGTTDGDEAPGGDATGDAPTVEGPGSEVESEADTGPEDETGVETRSGVEPESDLESEEAQVKSLGASDDDESVSEGKDGSEPQPVVEEPEQASADSAPDESPTAEPPPAEAAPPPAEAAPPPAEAAPAHPTPAEPAPRAHRAPRHTPPSRELADTWVVEIWVDPDWYAVQQTDEACPSAGVPDIVLLTRSSALVGRPSGSLGVRPEIDAGGDSAVSRRHAQLTSDGQRWWIEDLGSSNGTFVGTVGEPLPTTPLTPGQRVEIDRDDRIFVGAWTRLALRQATGSEKQGRG